MKTVYLAGPMMDCTESEIVDWRTKAGKQLNTKVIVPTLYGADVSPNIIIEDDTSKILISNIVLANCWKPSPGTSMEIMFGFAMKKIVISVVPEGFYVSPWIIYHSDQVFRGLDYAIDWINNNDS